MEEKPIKDFPSTTVDVPRPQPNILQHPEVGKDSFDYALIPVPSTLNYEEGSNSDWIIGFDSSGKKVKLKESGAIPIDAQNDRIINVQEPTEETDAANKAYVDNKISGNLELTGAISGSGVLGTPVATSFTFPINMQNQRIANLQEPVLDTDAANKKYVDDNSSRTIPLNAQNENIINVKTPTTYTDAANMKYVIETAIAIRRSKEINKFYVANVNSDSVSVINADTDTKIKDIESTDSPQSIAIDPTSTTAYVTSKHSNVISLIDIATNSKVDEINILGGSTGIDITPDGSKIYIVKDDSLAVINTLTHKISKEIPLPSGCKYIAIKPDGLKAYVTNFGNDANVVHVIDTSTDEKIKDISTNKHGPMGIAITPDGSKAYVCNNEYLAGTYQSTVSVLDLSSDTKSKDILSGSAFNQEPYLVTIAPNGEKGFVTDNSYFTPTAPVKVFDPINDTKITEISIGERSSGVTVSNDNSKVYIGHENSNKISVYNTSNYSRIKTIVVGDFPLGMSKVVHALDINL